MRHQLKKLVLAVLLGALAACSSSGPSHVAAPSGGDPSRISSSSQPADLSPERYLLLREGLKKINKVINLGNAAHVANQRLFSTPNIYSRGGLRNVMKAGDAWMAVSSQLETLTPDEEHEIDGLEGARRVLDVAVAAWLRFLTESGDAIVAGGGDAEHMRAISDYASGETVAGMALLNGAAKDAVASICKIASDDPACFLNSPEDLPS